MGQSALTDAAFANGGLGRRVVCEVNECYLLLDLVEAGLGVGVFPEGIGRDAAGTNDGELRLAEISDAGFTRRIDFVLPSDHAASPAARQLAESMQSAAQASGRRPKG